MHIGFRRRKQGARKLDHGNPHVAWLVDWLVIFVLVHVGLLVIFWYVWWFFLMNPDRFEIVWRINLPRKRKTFRKKRPRGGLHHYCQATPRCQQQDLFKGPAESGTLWGSLEWCHVFFPKSVVSATAYEGNGLVFGKNQPSILRLRLSMSTSVLKQPSA